MALGLFSDVKFPVSIGSEFSPTDRFTFDEISCDWGSDSNGTETNDLCLSRLDKIK
jgi:hypothetical protein